LNQSNLLFANHNRPAMVSWDSANKITIAVPAGTVIK
jgi:hypothetical protein